MPVGPELHALIDEVVSQIDGLEARILRLEERPEASSEPAPPSSIAIAWPEGTTALYEKGS